MHSQVEIKTWFILYFLFQNWNKTKNRIKMVFLKQISRSVDGSALVGRNTKLSDGSLTRQRSVLPSDDEWVIIYMRTYLYCLQTMNG